MTATNSPPQQPASPPRSTSAAPIKLYKNYDLFYWWAVWLYAAVASVLTGSFGKAVAITDKPLKFASDPLLGIGFIAVLLFVAIFTSVRARGSMSVILVFVFVGIAVIGQYLGAWSELMQRFPDLRVHMNQAFYTVIAGVLFVVWFFTTFVFNRLRYHTFDHGRQVGSIALIGGGSKTLAVQNISVAKLSDDIFVHRVLGLRWLGLGTGDIVLSYSEPGGGAHQEVIANVWRVDRKLAEINKRIQ